MVQVIKRQWFVVTRKNGMEILLQAVPPVWQREVGLKQIPLLFTCVRRAEICRRMVQGECVESRPYEDYQKPMF